MQATEYGNSQRDRMFKKVNRKLEEEIDEMKKRAEKAQIEREEKEKQKLKDDARRAAQEIADKERKEREAKEAQIR